MHLSGYDAIFAAYGLFVDGIWLTVDEIAVRRLRW
jgi:hypothetical protein